MRRGQLLDQQPRNCRSACRYLIQPDYACNVVGLRVVCLRQGPFFNP
jgi:formylglycine-generating enzyme required for sulfatase activity